MEGDIATDGIVSTEQMEFVQELSRGSLRSERKADIVPEENPFFVQSSNQEQIEEFKISPAAEAAHDTSLKAAKIPIEKLESFQNR